MFSLLNRVPRFGEARQGLLCVFLEIMRQSTIAVTAVLAMRY